MVKTLNKFKSFVEQKLVIFKLLFFFSILIFIFYEIGRIFKGIDWYQVKDSLADQSMLSVSLMLVLGFISILPMLIYDFAIVSFLPGKFSKAYIVRSGWITNTFTNIAGFGGFLGATLRANFYNKNASKKQVLFALSKIALFLLAGLSIYCWIALIAMFGLGIGEIFSQYWFWLFGGGLYFPILLVVTRIKDSSFFSDLTLKKESLLILGSTLEWGAAGGFFLFIGWFMNVNVQIMDVFPLYVIASIVGIVSMMPGGLGSFDIFMLVGLTNLGVLNETSVVWLLFFRLFYYIVPFIIGIVLFIHDTGRKINSFLDGIPQSLLSKIAHFVLTVFLYTSGILILLESMVPNFAFGNSIFVKLYPYTFLFLNQISSIVFAFLLIGVARGIESKVKHAFWPTLVLLLVGIINTLWRSFSIGMTLFLAFVMLNVIFSRKELYRNHFQYSFGKLCFDGLLFAGVFLLYAIVGAINSPQYTIHHAVPDALLFPSEKIWFSGFMGLLIATVALVLLFKYLSASEDKFTRTEFPETRIKQIIAQFAGNETSHLAFLRDKNIYFYQKDGVDQLFFMYRKKANKLIVMGEPIGNTLFLEKAVLQLMREADKEGYQLTFYEVNSRLTLILHELGFDFIKTGEEGYVKLADFSLSGKKKRAQRALMNKFEREGYQFSFEQPPFSAEKMAEFRKISDSWLNGQNEKGFSLGFFDEYYLNQSPIAVIRDSKQQAVAFANIMPTGSKKILSVDLMRHLKDAPSGIMDKVFISLFEYGQKEGYEYFNMGMAPLSNVGRSEYSFIEERAAHLIYEYGYHFYGFQGLRSYKNKYVTEWHSKYTAYRKRNSVFITMLQLASVVNQKTIGDKSKKGTLLVANFFK
ncbi:bifunctional lysylphosphatidylglycerol flippase/synthetase MprF [Liquorilactobacillus uvarum]|uniref:bifunctional lysylphosphatidylglycerol flippase/synthetase MprF n=1 Tax=Liquorilactobacillus uvarum TaxID=303240 RepID=UPI002889B264|nr:bifunctional lysylphosphatidylglycerol flippase/synthetase MprF [Liquorilactobacillus uvarum]